MTSTPTVLKALGALVAVAVVTAGCGGHGSHATSPPTSTPHAANDPAPITAAGPATGASAEAVAAGAMAELYTWRPALEDSGNSLSRVRPWLSPAMLAKIGSLSGAGRSNSVRGSVWADASAQVDAQTFVSAERPPSEAAGHASRKVAITQTVRWPDGHSAPQEPFTVLVDLIETSAGWRVDDYRAW